MMEDMEIIVKATNGIALEINITKHMSMYNDDDDDNNNNNNNNNNNSVQFFIISVLHQQPEGQLQMQHKGIQDNKYNKTI
jgi:hypothetical protein